MAIRRTTQSQELAIRRAVSAPRPVWPKTPSANAFLPLVLLLAAVGPGLMAWMHGTLTPGAAAWGLCALDVLEGDWKMPGPAGQPAPPIVAWSTAAALAAPVGDKLFGLTLPAYLHAVLSLGAIYLIGRVWFTSGTGLLACFLYGLNPFFLSEVQRSQSSLCALFWSLASLLVYMHHLRQEEEVVSLWTAGGAISFACLLLTVGFNALWIPVIGWVNVLFRELSRKDGEVEAFWSSLVAPTSRAGVIVVVLGTGLASPWLFLSGFSAGPFAPWVEPSAAEARLGGSVSWLLEAMPVTLILALYGLFRAVRQGVQGVRGSGRSALLLVWSLIAFFAAETTAPTAGSLLFLLVPLNFLAARTLIAILRREVPDRHVLGLMLGTAAVLVFSRSATVRTLLRGRPMNDARLVEDWGGSLGRYLAELSAEQRLSLHFVLDVAVLVGAAILWLYAASRAADQYRRWLFGGFVVAALLLSLLIGVGQMDSPLRRDDPWMKVYQQLQKQSDVDKVVYVGLDQPEPRLRLMVRSLFRGVPRVHLQRREQLETVVSDREEKLLVLVTDTNQRLPRTYPIGKGAVTLTLAQIYDSPHVVAYAPIARKNP